MPRLELDQGRVIESPEQRSNSKLSVNLVVKKHRRSRRRSLKGTAKALGRRASTATQKAAAQVAGKLASSTDQKAAAQVVGKLASPASQKLVAKFSETAEDGGPEPMAKVLWQWFIFLCIGYFAVTCVHALAQKEQGDRDEASIQKKLRDEKATA